MVETSDDGKRGWRYSTRELLTVMLVLALAMGWCKSTQKAQQRMAQLRKQMEFVKRAAEDRASQEELTSHVQARVGGKSKGTLTGANLTGWNLRGVTIVGDEAAMQGTIFDDCDMTGVTMSGSFQGATFKRAKLSNATLNGSGSSFQRASFEGADLTGAILNGNLQASSFAGAKLVGTRIITRGPGFQVVNIDGADFSGADLSAIEPESLKSCYFQTPPRYDAGTRFPKEFDAAAEGWSEE